MRNVYAISAALLLAVCCIGVDAQAETAGRIRAGDMVYVEVFRAPEITQLIQVDPKGNIRLAYVGLVNIAGQTETKASMVVATALEKIMRKPKVTVSRSAAQPKLMSSEAPSGRGSDMVLEIIPLNNSSAESMYSVLAGMNSAGGNVSYDPNTNSIIITDTPSAVKNMRAAVEQLDQMQSQLTQVRIEAKIAEVRVGAMKEMGVRWFAQGDHASGGYIPAPRQTNGLNQLHSGTGPQSNEYIDSNNTSAGVGNGSNRGREFLNNPLTQRLNIPAQVATPGQAFIGFVNDGIDFGAMLDMLVSEDQAELLANPMTLTVNHQQAHIEMVDRIPYTEFGTEITGASSFSTKFIDAGILLDVVPHVYQDANGPYVKLDLKPEVSFPSGSNNGVPILSVRRSETIANVRDGQTLIVGGILSEDQREVVSKMPWLGDLPILGALFRHKEKVKDRRELMIFVTPTIYRQPEAITWDRMLDVSEHLRDSQNVPIAELSEPDGER